MNTALKPVRTREDCIDWLTMEEVEKEVFAAFVGAQRHARTWDFNQDAVDLDPKCALQPGTVLQADGQPWWSRAEFLRYMAVGIVWRLEALAKRKGVDDLDRFDVAGALGAPAFKQDGFADPYFAFLGGEVHTISNVDIESMPPAQRKAFKAAMKAGKPVTLPKGAVRGL